MRGPVRRAARRLAPALALLLCLTACGAPAPDTQALWQAAMADAVFSEDGEVEALVSLTPDDPDVIWDGAGERVLAGVAHLCERAALVVVVANELYSDGLAYDGDTAAYLACLSGLARAIAARADRVYEVVCGLSVCWKGEGS